MIFYYNPKSVEINEFWSKEAQLGLSILVRRKYCSLTKLKKTHALLLSVKLQYRNSVFSLQRSSYIEVHLPYRLSSIEDHLPSKDVFHQRLPPINSPFPAQFIFYVRLSHHQSLSAIIGLPSLKVIFN